MLGRVEVVAACVAREEVGMELRGVITGEACRAALMLALLGCEGSTGSTTADADTTGETTTAAATTGTGGAPTTGGPDSTTTGEPASTSTTDPSTGGPGDSTGEATTGTSGGETTTDAVDPCADNFLTWDNFGRPFMLTWCTGCHHSSIPSAERAQAPCSVNLDRHGDFRFWAQRVLGRAVDMAPSPMPPAAIIPAGELALLARYIECGAPGPDVGDEFHTCPDPP